MLEGIQQTSKKVFLFTFRLLFQKLSDVLQLYNLQLSQHQRNAFIDGKKPDTFVLEPM